MQRTYGGHLLGQTILAAAETVSSERVATSLHAYFLRTGAAGGALDYRVTTVRDGRSLSVRSVTASQAGRELATIQLAFAAPQEAFDEQIVAVTAPAVPDPHELPALHHRRRLGLPVDGINRPTRANWRTASRPLDIRYIDDHALPQAAKHLRCFWFRAEGISGVNQNAHRAIVAFASDRSMLPAIAKARGELSHVGQWPVASVDHALWFHTDVHTGCWYLYVLGSPFSTETNGLARGTIYDEQRRPVASVTQHGLMLR
jgi:acyl-CoA thioesterase-2